MSHKLVTTTTETYPTLAGLQDAIKNGNGPMTFDQRTDLLKDNKVSITPDANVTVDIELVIGTDDAPTTSGNIVDAPALPTDPADEAEDSAETNSADATAAPADTTPENPVNA